MSLRAINLCLNTRAAEDLGLLVALVREDLHEQDHDILEATAALFRHEMMQDPQRMYFLLVHLAGAFVGMTQGAAAIAGRDPKEMLQDATQGVLSSAMTEELRIEQARHRHDQ